MSGPDVEQTAEPGAATKWPAVLGAQQPPLGRWWFGATASEELEHRRGLVDAADLASKRLRNYDQPWWAANVRGLLEYVEQLEEAVAAAEERGAAKERKRIASLIESHARETRWPGNRPGLSQAARLARGAS